MGGIGKTQLAAAFARNHQHEHSAVFWLDGSSKERLEQSLVEATKRLPQDELAADVVGSLKQKQVDTEAVIQGLKQWLSLPTNKRWLLVIDNVDRDPRSMAKDVQAYDLEEYLPHADHGSVIVTSRLSGVWQAWQEVRLGKLDDEQSRLVLENNAGKRLEGKRPHRIYTP